MTLTADQASHAAFVTTRFKAGYDLEEVDVFIEGIAAALRAWETGPVSGPSYRILASDDVSSKKFSTTSLREGYEQDAIDLFMDEAARTLQDHETRASGPPPHGVLTSSDLLNKKFNITKFRQEGYEQDQVDEFLDEVVEVLKAYESRGLR